MRKKSIWLGILRSVGEERMEAQSGHSGADSNPIKLTLRRGIIVRELYMCGVVSVSTTKVELQ